jgi:hypothetical protein
MFGALLVSVGLHAEGPSRQVQAAPEPRRQAYQLGAGPVIGYDEAHKNTTTYARYPELIQLIQADGYRPRPFVQTLSAASLADIDILLTNDPATSLSNDEVSAVLAWVNGGGSLLLVLDHYASMQSKLTSTLGVRNWPGNGASVRTDLCRPELRGCVAQGNLAMNILFWRSELFPGGEPTLAILGSGGGRAYQSADAVLGKHAITEGRGSSERIRRVATFSGSAFEALSGGVPLLTLPRGAGIGAPTTTATNVVLGEPGLSGTPVAGWLQGAVIEVGKGRVAIFADSAVVSGGSAADAGQFIDNRQFVLNVFHWLSRVL